jgi:hypothetical protein
VNASSVPFAPPPSNPFATRFTRPGRLAPLDDDGRPLDLDALLDRLEALHGQGAIEGPHGSGKTNLLTALAARIAEQGNAVRLVRVRGVADALGVMHGLRGIRGGVLCIDGWERLPWLAATALRRWSSCRGSGLIVTAHRPAGLPLLYRTRPSAVVLAALVARLPDHGGRIGPADIADAVTRHAGDLREALYDLYDRFERRAG